MRGRVAAAVVVLLAIASEPAGSVVLPGPRGLIIVHRSSLATLVENPPPNATPAPAPGSEPDDRDPEVAPDLSKMTFGGPGGNIFVANFPSGTGRKQLTSSGDDFEPAFSPDSSTIVYACEPGICVLPASGLVGPTPVAGSQPGDRNPDFSQDGLSILAEGSQGIVVFPAPAGGPRTVLAGTVPGDGHPRVMPSGDRVVLHGPQGIVTVKWPGGGQRTVLGGTAPGDEDPFPSPDSMLVGFHAPAGIFTVRADGSGLRTKVPGSVAGDNEGAWAAASGPSTNPNTPVFAASSPCGSAVSVPLVGGGTAVQFEASDPDSGQTVRLAAAGVPAYARFTQAPGNPARATLEVTPSFFDWFVAFLNELFGGATTMQVTASDSGSPPKATPCVVTLRMSLFAGTFAR